MNQLEDKLEEIEDTYKGKIPKVVNTLNKFIINNSIGVSVIVIMVLMSIFIPSFATLTNLSNVLLQITVIGIPAIGLTFVLIGAGLDLSIGSNISLSALIGSLIMVNLSGFYQALGIVAIIIVGIVIGIINGLMIVKVGMNHFMMTLTGMFLLQGIAYALTESSSIGGLPEWYAFIGRGFILGVPVPIWIMIVFFVVGHYVIKYTGYGRMLYIIGGNREVARIAGLPIDFILISTYILCGFSAAISGIIMSSQLGAATPGMGGFILLDVIAAVIIGGASFFGGRGSIFGTLFGVILIGLISNGISLLGISYYTTMIVKGLIIFIAVALDVLKIKYTES